MKKRAALIVFALILALAFAAGCGSGKPAQPPGAESGVTTGKTAPAFSLSAPDGKAVSLPVPAKITVLNFWATWCPPCREEMPELDKFAKSAGADLAFYAINLQEPADKATAFLRQNGYTMPILLDIEGAAARIWRISSIPTTVVIDKQGVVRYRKTGPVTADELAGVLKGL
jgi:cytochrome c biogenesis protein CcmG/thiol:disulfide interchange protein DsbE